MASSRVLSRPFITGTPLFCSSSPFAVISSWSPLFTKPFDFHFRRTSPNYAILIPHNSHHRPLRISNLKYQEIHCLELYNDM